MALIFMEGFGDDTVAGKWSSGSTIYTTGNTSPRIPDGYWGTPNSDLQKDVSAATKIITGMGWFTSNNSTNSVQFLSDSGTVTHITVMANRDNGLIEIRRGITSGTVLASSSLVYIPNQWIYVEVSATISDTVGEVHVRLNGSSTDLINYTGDTKNGGTNTTIDRVKFSTFNVSGRMSDIYILDDTGSSNNDFLGDVAVRTLSPNGNGNSSQLTGSDGNQTDNYLLVDEKPFSGTDYTYSDTSGHKDTYAMENLPAAASTVFGLQVNASMRKDDAGLGQARHVLRSGGTDYVGNTETLSTTSTMYVGLYEQDPATTSAWTVSGVNSAEAGMEVV